MNTYEQRVKFLNSPTQVNKITEQVVAMLNELNKPKKFCRTHNEAFSELWEGEFLCQSCYENYFVNKQDSLEVNFSEEYNNLMQDSD